MPVVRLHEYMRDPTPPKCQPRVQAICMDWQADEPCRYATHGTARLVRSTHLALTVRICPVWHARWHSADTHVPPTKSHPPSVDMILVEKTRIITGSDQFEFFSETLVKSLPANGPDLDVPRYGPFRLDHPGVPIHLVGDAALAALRTPAKVVQHRPVYLLGAPVDGGLLSGRPALRLGYCGSAAGTLSNSFVLMPFSLVFRSLFAFLYRLLSSARAASIAYSVHMISSMVAFSPARAASAACSVHMISSLDAS